MWMTFHHLNTIRPVNSWPDPNCSPSTFQHFARLNGPWAKLFIEEKALSAFQFANGSFPIPVRRTEIPFSTKTFLKDFEHFRTTSPWFHPPESLKIYWSAEKADGTFPLHEGGIRSDQVCYDQDRRCSEFEGRRRPILQRPYVPQALSERTPPSAEGGNAGGKHSFRQRGGCVGAVMSNLQYAFCNAQPS